ncbi:Asp-tRNA(Asn)/Glu-tRNA(Gln) amidotransferase subunit GatA [Patescibacteria group bacterium]
MNLNELTLIEARKGLLRGDFSALELTTACFDRIKKVEPKVKAFLTICEKEALLSAKKADQEIKAGQKKPLLGLPMAVKDIYLTKGTRTTAGSSLLKDYIPPYESTVTSRLRESGAIIIGKTNLDAWAHGSSGENSDFEPTKNPWDTRMVPGGSSSGSGAAVAAGECLASLGTDTGGSIRCPASFCNLVGIKPTYGRVSRYGVMAMASSFDCPGLLARTVEDVALVLEIIAGQDKYDATMPAQKVPAYSENLKKKLGEIRVGLPEQYLGKGLDPEVKKIFSQAVAKFVSLGLKVVPVSLPNTEYAVACYYILVPSEVSSNLARFDGVRFGHQRESFGDEAKRRIMLGTHALSSGYYDAYYKKAQKVRTLIRADFNKVFTKVDALLAPVMPYPPFLLGEKVVDPLKMYLADVYTCPINLAGLPSLSLPCGFTGSQLPIGMQIIGPQFAEGALFQIGQAYQQVTTWHTKKALL